MSKKHQRLDSETISEILKREVLPASGCTEPSAIAIALSTAFNAALDNLKMVEGRPVLKRRIPAEEILKKFRGMSLVLDKNTYKNAASVGIPNTDGERGIKIASALALFGDPNLGLEFFESVSKKDVRFADGLIDAVKVKVKKCERSEANIFIEATVSLRGGATGVVRIEHRHTNITYVKTGKKIILKIRKGKEPDAIESRKMRYFKNLKISQMIAYIKDIPKEVADLVRTGIKLNSQLSDAGLKVMLGAGVGYTLSKLAEETGDLTAYLKARVASGCDARMHGELLPAMSVTGSGNQGIAATMPIVAYVERTDFDDDKLVKAVALSYIISIYATYHSSYLSAACGLVKAGLGATAGLAYYISDGTQLTVEQSMQNFIANVPGIVCDGGKFGCALKAATVTDASIQSVFLSMKRCVISSQEGILGETAEDSLRNMAKVFKAMKPVDATVVKILSSKRANIR